MHSGTGTTLLAPPQTPLIFQQYLERLGRRQAKPKTIRNMERTAVLFAESGLDPLEAEDYQIEEWLTGLPFSPRTRRLHLENLSAVYNYAVHRRVLQQAPTETVRLPREPDREPRILDPAELRHILGNCITSEQELLITTLMYTGMRRNEVRNMKWEDISPSSIRTIGKGDKLRHIPLHPALSELVIRQTPKSPYVFPGQGGRLRSENSLFNVLERVRGDVRCSFHDFRRTVATSLAENDVPERIINLIMGWSERTVGGRYYIRRSSQQAQEAILALYRNDPITTGGRR